MSAIDDLTHALIGGGMSPGEAAALVARAIVEGTTKPKSSGALRTQKWRDNKRHKTSQSVTCDTGVDGVTVMSQASQSVTCDAVHIEKNKNPEKKERKKSTPAIALPPDWQPSKDGREYARAKGWNEQRIVTEGERFRNHSQAHGRKHRDVEAAWRNWVTSPYQAVELKQGYINGKRDPTMGAFDDLLAGVEGGAGEGDPPMRDITPRRD